MMSSAGTIRSVMVLCAVLTALGCSSDDDGGEAGAGNAGNAGNPGSSGGTGGTGGTSGADAGDTGGSGGSGGTAGTGTGGTSSGGSGGTAGTGGNASIMCGTATCSVTPTAAMFGIQACCTTDDKCGAETGACLEINQAGEADLSCPSETSLQNFPLAGCCKPDNTCGLDYGGVGIGCVRREEVTQAMVMGWPLEAAACGAGDDDAGL